MKNNIILITIMIFILIFNQFFSIIPQSISIINEKSNNNDFLNENKFLINKSYVIEKFPYVSQETNFYCTYACPTMILKYYGIETDLYEILFNSGVGYSLIYSHPSLKRFILSCIATSNWKYDRQFLAEIYGLSYEEKNFYNVSLSGDILWSKYWKTVKNNIINKTPVLAIVDPIYLKSIRDCIKTKLNISDDIIEKIPEVLWNFFPCFKNHMIVIIGFNETNNTICFNDPSAEVFGFPQFGKYVWMNLTDFKNSIIFLSKNQPHYSFFYGIFKNLSQEPLDKKDRFLLSYKRNIERLKGNISYYDEYIINIWNCSYLGINGLDQYSRDISTNKFEKFLSIYTYKLLTTFYLFSLSYKAYYIFDKLCPHLLNLSDYHSQMNYCYQLAIEKKDISDFLWNQQYTFNDENISKICRLNSQYLNMESENFSKLANNFSKFLGKGFFINNYDAFIVLDNMLKSINNLIYLENKIINLNIQNH